MGEGEPRRLGGAPVGTLGRPRARYGSTRAWSSFDSGLRRSDAARADETRAVVRARQLHDLDVFPRVRRVHHAPAPQIETDMSEPGEHEHVSCDHPRALHPATGAPQGVRAVRHLDANSPVGPAYE